MVYVLVNAYVTEIIKGYLIYVELEIKNKISD